MNMQTLPNGLAPMGAGAYKLGAKGGRMAGAWQHIWNKLDREEWRGSLELAEDAASQFDLKKVTVAEMLCRMRAAGVIEQSMIKAETRYERANKDGVLVAFTSMRKRVHYRIAARETA